MVNESARAKFSPTTRQMSRRTAPYGREIEKRPKGKSREEFTKRLHGYFATLLKTSVSFLSRSLLQILLVRDSVEGPLQICLSGGDYFLPDLQWEA